MLSFPGADEDCEELVVSDDMSRGIITYQYADLPDVLRTLLEPHFRLKRSSGKVGYMHVSAVNSDICKGWQVQVRDPWRHRTVGVGNARDQKVAALMAAATCMDPQLLLKALGARNWMRQVMEGCWDWPGSDLRKWLYRVDRGGILEMPKKFKRKSRMHIVGIVPMLPSVLQHHHSALQSAHELEDIRAALISYHRDLMDPLVYDGRLYPANVEHDLLWELQRHPKDFATFMQAMFGYTVGVTGQFLFHATRPTLDLSQLTTTDLRVELSELVFRFLIFPDAKRKLTLWFSRRGIRPLTCAPVAEGAGEDTDGETSVSYMDTDEDE